MVREIVSFFGWKCEDERIARLLAEVDVRPAAENAHAFIRKVTPGDHAEKLSPETIEFLNRELADVLTAFGYVSEPPAPSS
jgi:hypothetical protein